MEASPFIRCLSTSARIAKPLGIKKIPINYLMSEWQGTSHIKCNPIPLLEFKTKSASKINSEHKLLGMEYVDTTEYCKQANNLFKESWDSGLLRVKKSVQRFKRLHKA